jgi:ATP-dependent Lon protease
MFMTTANVLDTIQPALRDRMDIIQLTGYTQEEKLQIAKRHLLPKQVEENGLQPKDIKIADTALKSAISEYTQEAGLRHLEREIGKICRKVARKKATQGKRFKTVRVNRSNIEEYLRVPKVFPSEALKKDQVGVVTGLAWTAVGGDILFIEAIKTRGKGKLALTGQLGDVMKESGQAAYSYAKANAASLGIDVEEFEKFDIHVHIPEGAIPKDGPSAGITMATALVSVLSGRKIRKDLAMTGEITLRGNVLPIGGVKEKLLAATRAKIKTVVLPASNKRNIEDLPQEIRDHLNFIFVDDVRQVFDVAFVAPRKPRVKRAAKSSIRK